MVEVKERSENEASSRNGKKAWSGGGGGSSGSNGDTRPDDIEEPGDVWPLK